MRDKVLEAYAKDNVLLTQEVCEILGVSRQQVNNLVKQGKIKPLKEAANASLFLKADIDEYLAQKLSLPITEKREIIGNGNTFKSLDHFRSIKNLYDKIEAVHLYFYAQDAIFEGNYSLIDMFQKDTLLRIDAPTCVLVTEEGEKVYYDGLNTGYGGTGPHGTYDMLISLGVSEKDAKRVFGSKKVSYYKEDGLWQVVEREETSMKKEKADIEGEVFVYNNSLVLLPNQSSLRKRELDYEQFIAKYEFFVPRPREVYFLSEEEALKTGHYSSKYRNKGIYQVIIKDVSGNELWLDCPYDENKPLSKQQNMESILRKVGFHISEEKKNSLSDKLKEWLGLTPIVADKIVYHKEI